MAGTWNEEVLGLIFTADRDICICVVLVCYSGLPLSCQFIAVAMMPSSDGVSSEGSDVVIEIRAIAFLTFCCCTEHSLIFTRLTDTFLCMRFEEESGTNWILLCLADKLTTEKQLKQQNQPFFLEQLSISVFTDSRTGVFPSSQVRYSFQYPLLHFIFHWPIFFSSEQWVQPHVWSSERSEVVNLYPLKTVGMFPIVKLFTL